MNTKHTFLVVLALAISGNQFALSTFTAREKSKVVDVGEERVGEHVVKQLEQTISTEPGRTIKLFGKLIPVHAQVQVPEAVDQPTSQGNIRNHLSDDMEKTEQRVTNVLVGTQPGQTSSAEGKLQSTTTEAGPRESTPGKEVDHSGRGVKRKASSRDEAQRPQARTGWDIADLTPAGKVTLSHLVRMWGIDGTQLEERRKEFSNFKLPDELKRDDLKVKLMAIGSLYFELPLLEQSSIVRARTNDLIAKLKSNEGLIKRLGLDPNKVKEEALYMYHNELKQPLMSEIIYMAIGIEYYRLLHRHS